MQFVHGGSPRRKGLLCNINTEYDKIDKLARLTVIWICEYGDGDKSAPVYCSLASPNRKRER